MTDETKSADAIEIFYSYAHEDENLRDELEKHLSNLKRQRVIKGWYDRDISAGSEWDEKIKERLEAANIILLLVSPDFMASDYSNNVEVARAMERHHNREARVIPVILRPVDWEDAPFSKLQALPTDAKPVTEWGNRDTAFLNVASGIRRAIEELRELREIAGRLTEKTDGQPPAVKIPPSPLVGFVARHDHRDRHDILNHLIEQLAPPSEQLVALWGAGGTGKTTIAAEAARELKRAHAAIRLVWTSALDRAELSLSTLLDDIATQLGHPELRPLAPEAKEAQVQLLLAAAPTLVVFDNFETVETGEQTRCVRFLKYAPCAALITTRQRIPEAYSAPLEGMLSDEANDLIERLMSQVQTPEVFTPPVRERIRHAAYCNPFVIEWIVAQIDDADEPRAVFEDLAHGTGDAAERVFDRSFKLPLLGDDGRAALLALSLFVPDASREALAEAAGFGNDARRLREAVKRLHRLRLVKPKGDENSRLTIEGLTRTLTIARLEKDLDASDFYQRFIASFLRYTEAHAQPSREDYDALEAERDNVLNAMDVAFALKDWESVRRFAGVIANPVSGMLLMYGYWDEATRRNEQALEASRNSQTETDVPAFAHNLALMRQNRGELEEARRLYNESLEINKRLGDQSGIAITLHQLAMLAHGLGELEEARRLYNESLEITKRLGNQSGIANTLHQLAVLAQSQGELEEARRFYNESLEINKRLGNQSGIAITLHNLAAIAQGQGELEEARRFYDESLGIAKRLGDQSGIAITLHELGRLAHGQGELEEARRLYDESLEINKRLGNQSGIALTLHQLGRFAQDQGELEEARRLYDESLEINKRLGNQGGIASTLHNLGLLEEREGNRAKAMQLIREALAICEKLGSPNAEIARRVLEWLENEAA